MKKILLINNENISVRNHRIPFMKFLIERGYEVVVASAFIDDENNKINDLCRFIELKRLNIHSQNPIIDLLFLFELLSLYRNEKPDFIFHFTAKPNIYGSIVAFLLSIPSVATVNGLGRIFEGEGFKNKLVSYLYKISISKSKKIFFQNYDDFGLFLEKKIITREKASVVFGSGIDTSTVFPITSENRTNNVIKFLFASRLIWAKGVKELIEATELIKNRYTNINIEVNIFGYLAVHDKSAVPLEYLLEFDKLGVIKYHGPSESLINEIKKNDVVILPSYYREGIPKILIEALALGKPIITTNNVGCREVVEEGKNGFLVDIKDSLALANAMIKMRELSNEKFKEFGDYSRNKAIKDFDQKKIFSEYLEILTKDFD
jgi:glycosyltransferase involved in cell wall biosynthesis